jgi:ankyrin repeat protein
MPVNLNQCLMYLSLCLPVSLGSAFCSAAARDNGTLAVLLRVFPDAEVNAAEGGVTPLHDAVRSECVHNVALLVQRGARTDVVDQWGQTPLDIAVENDLIDAQAVLLRAVRSPRRGVSVAMPPR